MYCANCPHDHTEHFFGGSCTGSGCECVQFEIKCRAPLLSKISEHVERIEKSRWIDIEKQHVLERSLGYIDDPALVNRLHSEPGTPWDVELQYMMAFKTVYDLDVSRAEGNPPPPSIQSAYMELESLQREKERN